MQRETYWPAVWVAILAGIVAAASVGKMPVSISVIREELKLSLVTAGWIVSMFNTLAVATGLFFGLASDRIGALRFGLVGLGTLCVGGLLGALATAPAMLLVSRFIEGAGFIATVVAAPSLLVGACSASDSKHALALWSVYMPTGVAATILVSPAVIAAVGWRGLWLGIAIATLLCGLLLGQMRSYYNVSSRPRGGLKSMMMPLRDPAPWWLALSFALYTVQFFAIITWLPTYVLQSRGATLTQAALLTAVVVASNVAGNLLASVLLRRGVSRGRLISLTFVVMGLCAIGILSTALADWVRYCLCVLCISFGGMIPAGVLSGGTARARSHTEIGGIQGLLVQGSNLGQFAGPPAVAAVVAATGGWESAVWVLVLCAAFGAVCGQRVGRFELPNR